MALNHNPYLVTNGLVYMLDPSNPKCWNGTSTTITSLVNNGTNTISGAPYGRDTSTYAVTALTLNNAVLTTATSTASVTLSTPSLDVLAASNNFTVMFAAKKNYHGLGGNSNGNSQILQGSNNGYNNGWRIVENSQNTPGLPFTGAHSFSIGIPDITKGFTVNDSSSTNRMSIVAFSISYTSITGFINGAITSTSNSQAYTNGSGNPTISWTGAGVGSWNGLIGFLMIYNRALTSAELTQNYNALKGRYRL